MPGKKGQKGWNKREEFDWRDLVGENKTLLMKLAKKYNLKKFTTKDGDFDEAEIDLILADRNKSKLFFKALDTATALCVKAMPNKVEGAGEDGEIVIRVEKVAIDAGHLQAPRFAIPNLQ